MSRMLPCSSNNSIPNVCNLPDTFPSVTPNSSSPSIAKSPIRAKIVLKPEPIVSGASRVTEITVPKIAFNWSISTPAVFAADATLLIPVDNSSRSAAVPAATFASLSTYFSVSSVCTL